MAGLGREYISPGEMVSPVNPSDGGILTKRRLLLPSLLPDLLTMLRIVRRMKGIVNSEHDDKRPGEGHQNAVSSQSVRMMRFTPSKRIIGSHDGEKVTAPA